MPNRCSLSNASNVPPINMLHPHDFSAFEMLDRYIQHEYVDEETLSFGEWRGRWVLRRVSHLTPMRRYGSFSTKPPSPQS
jgi:hypothetical protein